MIKRVSEAILNTPNASDYAELVAKNAIKAMRELSIDVWKIGEIDIQRDNRDFEHTWKIVIDEILK